MLLGIVAALGLDPAKILPGLLLRTIVGLGAVCLIASSNYVLNEMLDARSDRAHPLKRSQVGPAGDQRASRQRADEPVQGSMLGRNGDLQTRVRRPAPAHRQHVRAHDEQHARGREPSAGGALGGQPRQRGDPYWHEDVQERWQRVPHVRT